MSGKYKLFVSMNCGGSYYPEQESDDPKTFEDRCRKLDEKLVRWYIEGPDGDHGDPCAIHKEMILFMAQLAQENEES